MSNAKYDIVIVGAGLFAATVVAILKDKYRILVLETRDHVAGNCYDYKSGGTLIHKYGPHIFHSTCPKIVDFLSKYTEWNKFEYKVSAEIDFNNELIRVPFPYSEETQRQIGQLSPDRVLDLFFRSYSKKMWGIDYDLLPESIRGRVPKDSKKNSLYFPGQFQAMPKLGYTHMIGNMFDGVEVILGADPNDWKLFYDTADLIIYCGRPDHIISLDYLEFRDLDIVHLPTDFDSDSHSINFCHLKKPITRITSYKNMTGGSSNVCSTETPIAASNTEVSPFYPIQTIRNFSLYSDLVKTIGYKYPKLSLCGRLGSYKYMDMYQIVGQAMAFIRNRWEV